MKYNMPSQMEHNSKSRPARGAWVEIEEVKQLRAELRRAPQGARGLKSMQDLLVILKYVAPRKGRVG